MSKKTTLMLLAATTAMLALGFQARAEEAYVGAVKEYIEQNVKPWLADPAVIEAIKAQNTAHAAFSQADIDAMDQKWRDEVDGDSRPTVDAALATPLSAFLKEKAAASNGVITEVFVMDNKGLNVGQSDVTSDFWQGDEDKFQKSFGAGKDAVFVDEAEKDESTQKLQSQASVTISDEAGNPIGAITIGIDLDSL